MKAQAVVFVAPNTVAFHPVDCPDPGPQDVVIRVTHSWISNGTEGSFLRGERIGGDVPYRPGDPWPFPLVPGYQKVGVVQWVGADITDVAIGETVFATMGKVQGMFSDRGGHISPSISPRDQVWKIPDHLDPVAVSGLVLTQVGYNCGARAPLQAGEGAVVIGDGLVGQWAAQTLAWRGAQVVLVGRHDDRLARFAGDNAHVVNAHREAWSDAVRRLLPQGVQVGVDTVGAIPVVEELASLMKRYGHIVSAGFYGTQDRLALQPLRIREISVDMVAGWSQERMDRTLELVASGDLRTLPLITHRFTAQEADQAWRLIEGKSEPVLGVILDWE